LAKQKNNWSSRIANIGFIKKIVYWSKNHTLPGFQGISIFNVFNFIANELRNNDLNVRASAISFSFFLALFPSLIFIFTLTAYLPKSWDFYTALENSIFTLMPDKAEDYFWKNIVSGIRPRAKGGILSIGVVLAIYFASEGIMSLMRGFDKAYKSSFRRRSWLEKQAVALFLTFLLSLLLIFSILVLILGTQIFQWVFGILKLSKMGLLSIKLLQYLIIGLLFYSIISLIYRYGPALRKPLKRFTPGAIFATVTSILSSILFGYFVDHFSNYHKVYGAISALIITLVWIRINVLILILGFELNASIVVNRDLKIANESKQSLS
jgi:membrane protein